MPQNASAKNRRRPHRSAAAGQYSLFAPTAPADARDARYFHRQAALCERLLSSVHQPELCDRLASLQAEFEAAAAACADGSGRR
ncbi:MAG: hypothetical protein JWL84_6147 [Rhodospirillales bacterium]|jgi:hypothetical protein|nr:hypothetical protein [Rhodospirillales bacterium]